MLGALRIGAKSQGQFLFARVDRLVFRPDDSVYACRSGSSVRQLFTGTSVARAGTAAFPANSIALGAIARATDQEPRGTPSPEGERSFSQHPPTAARSLARRLPQ